MVIDVRFPTISPFVLKDVEDPRVRAQAQTAVGHLYMPPGAQDGPRVPGIVLIEGLGGLKTHRECAYGEWLAEKGFATLVINSFATRGKADASDNERALRVTESMMLADAFAGLRYLRQHPAVDGSAISIIGFSYGGMITFLTAYDQIRRLFLGDEPGFRSHVSFYGCSVPRPALTTATGAPLLFLLGERDRNVSIPRTRTIARDLEHGGSPSEVIVYPGVHHQWNGKDMKKRLVRFALHRMRMRIDPDNTIRDERTGLTVRNLTTRTLAILLGSDPRGYYILRNEDATRDSDARTITFLRRHGTQPDTPAIDRSSRRTASSPPK